MAILSYDELLQRSRLDEQRLIKSASAQAEGKRVFLSYSSVDRAYVPGVVDFFAEHDAPAYIDQDDSELPDPPSLKTAQTLADNIGQCPKLVVLVSPLSKASRWVPWELGLAHGRKGLDHVATLPIGPSSTDEAWAEREYLGLYLRIKKATLNDGEQWAVRDPRDGKYWNLKYWLHKV